MWRNLKQEIWVVTYCESQNREKLQCSNCRILIPDLLSPPLTVDGSPPLDPALFFFSTPPSNFRFISPYLPSSSSSVYCPAASVQLFQGSDARWSIKSTNLTFLVDFSEYWVEKIGNKNALKAQFLGFGRFLNLSLCSKVRFWAIFDLKWAISGPPGPGNPVPRREGEEELYTTEC